MKRVFCTLFVLAIAMVVGCGSGPSDTDRIGVSKPAQSTKSEPAKRATRTSTREATVPGKPLDDYARAMQPIEDKLDKLYERMNQDFDKIFAGMAAALNSSSQAEKAQAIAKAQSFSDQMYTEWDTLLRRFVQITPPPGRADGVPRTLSRGVSTQPPRLLWPQQSNNNACSHWSDE